MRHSTFYRVFLLYISCCSQCTLLWGGSALSEAQAMYLVWLTPSISLPVVPLASIPIVPTC